LVSVIIPCKDAAAWLGEAIESCLAQTWREIEIIVVDNGSSDASPVIARRFSSASVAVLECARSGASAARNRGLEHARGDLIQFLDADDMLDREKIRVQVERLAAVPAGSIASGAWARFRDQPGDEIFAPEPVWRDLPGEEFLTSSWSGGGMMANFAWLTPRTIIERVGPWNERLTLNDDGEFFCRVALAASGIAFCDGARGYYRRGSVAAISRRRDREALASAFAAIELSCSHLLAHCDSVPAARACAIAYQRFICDAYPAVPDFVAAAERRVAQLGGSDLRPQGGPAFNALSRWLGWKIAKRCRSAWWRLSGLTPSTQHGRR
jgi:glycosyltransferase involved in cell wall biosynthesis